MDPHPVQSAIKSVGKTIGRYDPTNPANMGRVAPLAASMGTMALSSVAPEASIPLKLGLSLLGGAAAPYVEAGTKKALGEPATMPTWKTALKAGAMNMAFEGMALKNSGKLADAAADLSKLPAKQQTLTELRQQVRNTDFLKGLGLDDKQIAEAREDPEGTAQALYKSHTQGRAVADTFNKTIAGERDRFHQRFDAAYGAQKTASAPVTDIAQSFQQAGQGAGQHELTPSFSSWLERKGKELQGIDLSQVPDPLAPRQAGVPQKMLDPNNPIHAKRIAEMQKQGVIPSAPNKPFSVEDMAALRTELHENIPANPTPLDRKAALALDSQITAKWEDTLRKAGASEEQIGRLKGTYQDWGNFQQTVKGLRPGSKDFGEQTADAFFKTAKQNPTLALNFAKMAEDSGTMPEFRESFIKQLTQEMRGAQGGPVEEMRAVQKLRSEWGTTDDGKAVLSSVFGKDSPLSNDVEMSKFLGSLDNPKTQDALARSARTMGNIGFSGRQAVFLLATGGSLYRLQNHPDEWPQVVAALGGLAVAPALMARLSGTGQRAMIKMLATPSAEAVNGFLRIAGPSLSTAFSQPSPNLPAPSLAPSDRSATR